MEEYLYSLGLYKKAIAKDGSSLFRAVSEQLFFTQAHSFRIRQLCADFIEINKDLFEKHTNEDLDSHVEKIRSTNDYPGLLIFSALSKLYKRNFMIYQEVGEPPYQPVDSGHRDTVVLAGTDGVHYDTVYPKSHLSASALCQSIVYEILYKRVFKFGECVDMAVSKMLHDKAYSKQRRCHLLNQSFAECFKLDDSEDKPNEQQDAEAEIKRALAQGIPPFPYKVAKALDPLIYRNVEYDIWNEKRKEQMKNDQLVTPDIAPGVKCLVRLHDQQKEPFVAYIQELISDQGPVTVYIEELCKKYTLPLNFVQVLPVPAYKVMWQSPRQQKGFPGCPISPGQEKCKGKRKCVKKGPVPNLMCLTPPRSPDQVPETTTNQQSQSNSGRHYSYDSSRSAPHYKYKNRSCDKRSQNNCLGQSEKISPTKNCGFPVNYIQRPCDPEPCHTAAPCAQPWRRPNQMYQTPPITIPVKTDNLRRVQGPDFPVANVPKDIDLYGEAGSLAGSPNGFSPLSFVLTSVYPCDAVSCISSEYSPLNCDTNSPPTVTPPSQIPASQPVSIPQPPEEVAQASAVQASGSPLALYPCPWYTGMLVMYADGTVHPVTVSPWRQEYSTTDNNTQGVPGVYYNGLGTPPNCISSPVAQWVSTPTTGYSAQWASGGGAFAAASVPGEIAYPTTFYSTPSWSPPSGFVVPPQVSYQMPPSQPQFIPVQQMQTAGQKPPA